MFGVKKRRSLKDVLIHTPNKNLPITHIQINNIAKQLLTRRNMQHLKFDGLKVDMTLRLGPKFEITSVIKKNQLL